MTRRSLGVTKLVPRISDRHSIFFAAVPVTFCANELLRRCGTLPGARRDVQAEQSIALTIGLIGHPQSQAIAVPNRSRNFTQKLAAGHDRFAPRRLNVREFHAVAIKRRAPITHMKKEE